MPNIRPGMTGGNFLPPQNVQQKQAAQVQKPQQQAQTNPTDKVSFQGRPTGAEGAQRLTSETTKVHIQQLIQTTVIQPPKNPPQLQLLNRPAMSSALAETLAGHQPAETQNAAQQSPQNTGPNVQAQLAGGSLAAASNQKIHDKTEDTAKRNTAQSGKRARKEEQEGEFSSLADAESGTNQGDSGRDERSDSQKKKNLLKDDFENDDFDQAKKKPLPTVKTMGIKRTGTALSNRLKKKPMGSPSKPSSNDEWTL